MSFAQAVIDRTKRGVLALSELCPTPQSPMQTGQVIPVHVGLVQTDVMVFDKQGRFVPGLKMDQFELRIDGKAQPLSFFEMVAAGSSFDEAIWAKAVGKAAPSGETEVTKGINPGRVLLCSGES